MTDQTELDDWPTRPANESTTSESSEKPLLLQISEIEHESQVLFRFTSDEFVNEGAAELGRLLAEESLITIEPDAITLADDADIEDVISHIHTYIKSNLANTHQRNARAYQINRELEEMGRDHTDSRWVSKPTIPFPNTDDVDFGPYSFDSRGQDETIYPDDAVDSEALESNGLDPDIVGNEAENLFKFSGLYVGNPRADRLANTLPTLHAYVEDLKSGFGDKDTDHHRCMVCGSDQFPSRSGSEENPEYNQAFNIWTTTSGSPRSLGQSLDSSWKGRCVACLVAGFFYTIMEKPVRQLDTSLYRVFAPVGDFETLLRVRRAYAETALLGSLDDARDSSKNLGQIRTDSAGFQVLDFFSEIRRHANVKQTDGIRTRNERLPTTVRMFESTPMKSGRPIRGIGGFDQVAGGEWVYELVTERGDGTDEPFSYEGESGTYWPFSAVLSWYASIELPSENSVTHEQDMLAYGLLEQDLQRIEDGIFRILKIISQNREEVTTHGVLPRDATHHYFATIMRQTHQTGTDEQISDEVMKSIQRLGRAIGHAFHDREDIGVLSSLKNANTYEEFLVALEDAALEVQKRRTEDSNRAEAGWYKSEDIDRFLTLLNQSSNFASAKRMFVIHVCLEAQRVERASQYNEENSDRSDNK